MNQASPTASMAGARIETLPVISATINITASGAREILPKQHIMPTITYGAGLWPMEGTIGSNRRHTAAPMKAPMTMPGPKMPPDPPEPIDSPVARMRANGKMRTTHSGSERSWWPRLCWIQPYPVPSTSGMARAMEPTSTPPTAGFNQRGAVCG